VLSERRSEETRSQLLTIVRGQSSAKVDAFLRRVGGDAPGGGARRRREHPGCTLSLSPILSLSLSLSFSLSLSLSLRDRERMSPRSKTPRAALLHHRRPFAGALRGLSRVLFGEVTLMPERRVAEENIPFCLNPKPHNRKYNHQTLNPEPCTLNPKA